MSPLDSQETGRTLGAPEVTIDGQSVRADGSWPVFNTENARSRHSRLDITLGVTRRRGHGWPSDVEELGIRTLDVLMAKASRAVARP